MNAETPKYQTAATESKYKNPFYLDNPIRHAQEIIGEVGRISYFLSFTFDMAAHHGFISDVPPLACEGLRDLQDTICVRTEQAENLLEMAHQERVHDREQLAGKEPQS
jgi:hypothetical protein